jgi:hypothetical protein
MQQDKGDERVDKESQGYAAGMDIQDGKCQTKRTLPVLWSDR